MTLHLPGFKQLKIPPSILAHPLVRARFFYTLHPSLLRLLRENAGTVRYMETTLLDIDQTLTSLTAGFDAWAGFWNGMPVSFRFYDLPLPASYPDPIPLEASAALDSHHLAARAYLGWLLTNPDFLAEQTAFFRTWRRLLDQTGFPSYVPQNNAYFLKQPRERAAKKPQRDLVSDYHALLLRWALERLAGPYLPVPLMTHEILLPHGLSVSPLRTPTMGISVPVTAPLPAAEILRTRMEEASGRLRGLAHLAGWVAIVKNANRQRANELPRYQRVARLVHYWRALHSRHPRMRKLALPTRYGVFAEFLGVSEDTIDQDMRLIRRSLHARSNAWDGATSY